MGLWNRTSLGEAFLLRIHRGSGFVATHNQTVANLCKAVRWSGKRPPTSPISIRPSERGHINFTIQVWTRSTDHEELVLASAVMIASGILVCQCHVVLLSRRDVGVVRQVQVPLLAWVHVICTLGTTVLNLLVASPGSFGFIGAHPGCRALLGCPNRSLTAHIAPNDKFSRKCTHFLISCKPNSVNSIKER